MERCPSCKSRLKAESIDCSRCGAELQWVILCEMIAKQQLNEAIYSLVQQQPQQAAAALAQSLSYQKTPMALLLRDFLHHKYGRFG
ncbi:MAG: hypothetical protein K9L60_03425 [Methylovulum sp.]|jgi:hypothetical protein|nr:hypothetical protein [Methylovulum sp.]MCF7998224.1 hypothetical protein [Methylovulum sp.]